MLSFHKMIVASKQSLRICRFHYVTSYSMRVYRIKYSEISLSNVARLSTTRGRLYAFLIYVAGCQIIRSLKLYYKNRINTRINIKYE